jgi:hypothetical protein
LSGASAFRESNHQRVGRQFRVSTRGEGSDASAVRSEARVGRFWRHRLVSSKGFYAVGELARRSMASNKLCDVDIGHQINPENSF